MFRQLARERSRVIGRRISPTRSDERKLRSVRFDAAGDSHVPLDKWRQSETWGSLARVVAQDVAGSKRDERADHFGDERSTSGDLGGALTSPALRAATRRRLD